MTSQQQLPLGAPAVDLAREYAESFRPMFVAWLERNLEVWLAFEREANRVWARGRRHYSARTILEHLRHESTLAEKGPAWKLDNDVAPDLARLWRLAHPRRAEFFETRRAAGRERAA